MSCVCVFRAGSVRRRDQRSARSRRPHQRQEGPAGRTHSSAEVSHTFTFHKTEATVNFHFIITTVSLISQCVLVTLSSLVRRPVQKQKDSFVS